MLESVDAKLKRLEKYRQFNKDIKTWGLKLFRGSIVWSPKFGSFRWIPYWIKILIIAIWNPIQCFFTSHDYIEWQAWMDDKYSVGINGPPHCPKCSKNLLTSKGPHTQIFKTINFVFFVLGLLILGTMLIMGLIFNTAR